MRLEFLVLYSILDRCHPYRNRNEMADYLRQMRCFYFRDDAVWLGIFRGLPHIGGWIYANNEHPGDPVLADQNGFATKKRKQAHKYAESDIKAEADKPWIIPSLATLSRELPKAPNNSIKPVEALVSLLLGIFDVDLGTDLSKSKWIRFGDDWTAADLDTVIQVVKSGNMDARVKSRLSGALAKIVRKRNLNL